MREITDEKQNDDGFGTANIRELYKAMKAFGHNVYIVASVVNQSGKGRTVEYTKEKNLTGDSEFGILPFHMSNLFSQVSRLKRTSPVLYSIDV